MFWLKPGLSVEEIDRFKGFFEQLKTISSVASFTYGRAAGTEKREVVDNSFSYAMFAEFATLQDHESYQTDPVHLNAIEEYSKYWEKVVVHDTQLITP